MGAELWFHTSGPHASPREALREIQAVALAAYDLPSFVQQHVQNVQQAVASCEEDDEYGLLDFYRDELQRLEAIAAEVIPADTAGQIALLRRLCESSGQGVGNVLDVIDVCDSAGVHITRICTNGELIELIGSDRPTYAESQSLIWAINERMQRGESVCFQVFSDDRSTGLGWCFVGNSID